MKNSIVLATAVAAVLTSGVAAADLSGNAGVFSNYIWRGVTQTDDQAAGQGGIDWGNDSGLYAGTWVSNVTFPGVDAAGDFGTGSGYEMDVYAGFAGEAGSVGYDVGVITYQYPTTPGANFTEVYVSGSISGLTVGVAATVDSSEGTDDGQYDDGDVYVNASYDFTAGKSDVSVYAGSYSFDHDGDLDGDGAEIEADYSHFGASIGKDGFTFAVDKNDYDGALGRVRFTASYSMDFEL